MQIISNPLITAACAGALLAMSSCQRTLSEGGWIDTGAGKIWQQTYTRGHVSAHPQMVVVLHGDAPHESPSYQYEFARTAAAKYSNVVAVALLRPGYADPGGNYSEGERGEAVGDNWTATNTDMLAKAIRELRRTWQPRHVVLAGHSGGGLLAGNILGRHPGLAHDGLVVSMPCDPEMWRQHMLERTGYALYRTEVDALSPVDLLPAMPKSTRLRVVFGAEDDITPPLLSRFYRDAAAREGIMAESIELEGRGHDIFLEYEVMRALGELLD